MKILFRIDDGPSIGAGHLMRCFALAEAFSYRGGEVFLSTTKHSSLHKGWVNIDAKIFIEPRSIGSEKDLEITNALVEHVNADWLVVDGYSFSDSWLSRSETLCRVLYIDDLGASNPKISAVLNHNPGAELRCKTSYSQCQKVLLGLDFFLLRQAWHNVNYRPEAMRLLITLGGDDQDERTLKMMKALILDGRPFIADVVSSAGDEGSFKELKLAQAYPKNFVMHRAPVSLPELMARVSTVICGGGITSVEAVSIGLFPIIVILADNQKPAADYMQSKNIAKKMSMLDGNNSDDVAHLTLNLMNENKKETSKSHFVNMNGCFRVIDIMGKGFI